jgi:SAM-dependent methyltransferase
VFEGSTPRHEYLLRRARRLTESSRPSLLNIGAGSGFFERQALAAGLRVATLDPDPATIARLEADGVAAKAGSITRMPFDDGSFDVVVASEVLEHLTPEEGQQALVEVARVLRPGGAFLGTVPFAERLQDNVVFCPHCHQTFHRWGHQRAFTRDTMSSLLAQALRVESMTVRSFVAWRGRSWRGKAKSAFKALLGRMGEPIASPHLLFVARRA